MEFTENIASGMRFRYQSEIDTKSFSSIKGERGNAPTLKVFSPSEATLQLDLVTSTDNVQLHFNTFYEMPKIQNYSAVFEDGVCFIPMNKDVLEIKLDFIGIRKWKSKEAIPRIQQLYKHMNGNDAKKFYNENKNTVMIRASLIAVKYVVSSLLSNIIKSQTAKENKDVKIQHISPKTVADIGETLIIVLEKKLTSECNAYIIFDQMSPVKLIPTHEDGQTFVFRIPPYTLSGHVIATVKLECCDQSDSKPIRFLKPNSEFRKRKSSHESNIPLKKPTNYDSPTQLFPESGGLNNNIEFDGPCDLPPVSLPLDNASISGNDSCKDSGINSDDKSCTEIDSDSDGDVDDRSYNESDDDEDLIEIEGGRRRRVNHAENLEPINFPPTKRTVESYLEPNRKDQVAAKIFSEVARIGHDFAFGKEETYFFSRIEKQLPVVFTLQDDVGDTPLNNAILKGNLQPAERILKVVQDECKWALDLKNTSGHTALILAPACDIPSTFITKLLDAGCRLELCDDLGKSAITYAIEYKNTDALSVILDYIKKYHLYHLLKRQNRSYHSYLQLAVMSMYAEGVKMLLSLMDEDSNYMVDVNEVALMNEDTALHIAVEREVGLDIIKLLLLRPDIDINHKKDKLITPLHTAIKMKSDDVVALLRAHMTEDIHEDMELDENSINEMDDNDTVSYDACDIVQMMPEQESGITNIINLTTEMENMSLKGDTKKELIAVLLNTDTSLSVEELRVMMKPAFQPLISRYNSMQQYQAEIADILHRFNCFPNSLGQVIDKLRELNRIDIVKKVTVHFHNF